MEGNWRKSTYSDGASNCVELAPGEQGLLVRDSKAPQSGMLAGAAAFVAAVKAGEYDR